MTLALGIWMALVYVPLTVLLLFHYLRDKTPKRLHLLLAFTAASIGFIANLVEELLALGGYMFGASLAFKLFDIFEMAGVFMFFVFLTDFVQYQKRYIGLSYAALLLVIFAIALSPLELVKQGSALVEVRYIWAAGIGIIAYWLTHFGVISYEFWRYSKLIEERLPRARMQLIALGGLYAVLAYLAVIILKSAFPDQLPFTEIVGAVFAVVAGILFYLGAETPNWLKSIL
ncbi:MAG: hypothetical protein WA148_05320 [Actinomycetota bacterium]